MLLKAVTSGPLKGSPSIPGDKSLSHRALMLGGLAAGCTEISGILASEDIASTQSAMQALGCEVEITDDGTRRIHGRGVGGLIEPGDVLDMGNAGTGARLLTGILATHPFTSFMTGDASLCKRPMQRVIEPLSQMGGLFQSRSGGRLPMCIVGTREPLPIDYHSPVASAQIKSAVLMAGLMTPGWTTVHEPSLSRDHSERMLRAFGARVESGEEGGLYWSRILGEAELRPQKIAIPADPSSAAFLVVAALITEGSELRLTNIGMNPTRAGLFGVLGEMGADLTIENRQEEGGEPVADLLVRSSRLRAIDVPPEIVPSMVDEYPILAVAASVADGNTVMRGLHELRVKESDRLTLMAEGLKAVGIDAQIEGDDLHVQGGTRPQGGITVDCHHDHRIAMSFIILGGITSEPVHVAGAETIATSFPDFVRLMNELGGNIEAMKES